MQDSDFHAAWSTIFSRMTYNGQIFYNTLISYFKWRHSTGTGKSPLLSWKVFTWIMVKTSQKIHLNLNLLKYVKPQSICFTTTVNKSVTSFKDFNNSRELYIWCFIPCYHNLPMRICSCACICSLVQHIVLSINGDLQLFI